MKLYTTPPSILTLMTWVQDEIFCNGPPPAPSPRELLESLLTVGLSSNSGEGGGLVGPLVGNFRILKYDCWFKTYSSFNLRDSANLSI